MTDWLSVERIAVTVLGYPLSYIELVGTVLYLASVWLVAKRRMLTWPIGILSVLLFGSLFYQVELYSDAVEQIYYLAASIYGWVFWGRTNGSQEGPPGVRYSTPVAMAWWGLATVGLAIGLGTLMTRIHLWLPAIFAEPAAYPFVDAATTVMSFTAMWLLARKRIESWLWWIGVDVVGIVLYHVRGIRFVSLLYVVLLVLAVRGFSDWTRHRAQVVQPAVAGS